MNHSLKTGLRGSSRDIGLPTSEAGKGDSSRITDHKSYDRNLAEISFPGVQGLVTRGHISRKFYPRPK